jgi:hypothetical protein
MLNDCKRDEFDDDSLCFDSSSTSSLLSLSLIIPKKSLDPDVSSLDMTLSGLLLFVLVVK